MQYGAYRRWKLAEDSQLDSKGKPKKKKSKSSTGYVAGDYKLDGVNGVSGGEAIGAGRDVGGKKKKNKGGSLNSDSFYDAIKKFGGGVKVIYYSIASYLHYSTKDKVLMTLSVSIFTFILFFLITYFFFLFFYFCI